MQFLKTLFWVALAVGLVVFSIFNWTYVPITLWGGLEALVRLPILIFAAFLLGFLPTFLLYQARVWTLKRRVENLERQTALAHSPATEAPATPGTVEPVRVEPVRVDPDPAASI